MVDHLAVLHRDREAARVGAVERACGFDDGDRTAERGFADGPIEFAWGVHADTIASSGSTLQSVRRANLTRSTCRDRRRRIRRPARGARARGRRRAGHAARSPQLPPVPAAAVSGGDCVAVARRRRVADPLDSAPPEKRRGAAGRRARDRSRRAARHARPSPAEPRPAAADMPGPSPTTIWCVATGAAHAYFGHPEWADRAPGLKTLDDALEMRRRVLLAFEAAERETDPERQRRLLTFVIVGGGPTGVELAGALAEIARQSLRQDFRRIRPESARIVLVEGSPHVLAPFPEPLRAGGAQGARAPRRRGADRLGRHRYRRGRRDAAGARHPCQERRARDGRADRSRDRALGRRRRGVAAGEVARRTARPRRPRDARTDARACRAIPRSSSSAMSARSRRTASCCRAWRRWRCSRARTPARNIRRAIEGKPLEPFRYKDYGIMATIGRGSAVGDIVRRQDLRASSRGCSGSSCTSSG